MKLGIVFLKNIAFIFVMCDTITIFRIFATIIINKILLNNEVKKDYLCSLKNSVYLFLVSDLHNFKYHQSKWLSGVGLFVW